MWRILNGTVPVFVKELNPQLRQNWFIPHLRIRVLKCHTDTLKRDLEKALATQEKDDSRSTRWVNTCENIVVLNHLLQLCVCGTSCQMCGLNGDCILWKMFSMHRWMLDIDSDYKPVKLYDRLRKRFKFQEEGGNKELAAIHLMQEMCRAKNYLNVMRLSQELLMDSSLPPAYHAVARLYYCSTLLLLGSFEELSRYSLSLPRSKENFRAWQFIALLELRRGRSTDVLKILSDIPFNPYDKITLNLQIQACVHLKQLPEVMLLIKNLVKSHKGQCVCRDTLLSINQLEENGTKMSLERFERYKKWLNGGNFIVEKDMLTYMVQEINLKEFFSRR